MKSLLHLTALEGRCESLLCSVSAIVILLATDRRQSGMDRTVTGFCSNKGHSNAELTMVLDSPIRIRSCLDEEGGLYHKCEHGIDHDMLVDINAEEVVLGLL